MVKTCHAPDNSLLTKNQSGNKWTFIRNLPCAYHSYRYSRGYKQSNWHLFWRCCLLWGKKTVTLYLKPRALMKRLLPWELKSNKWNNFWRRAPLQIKRCTFRGGRGSRMSKGMEVGISKGGLNNRKKTQKKSKSTLGHCAK